MARWSSSRLAAECPRAAAHVTDQIERLEPPSVADSPVLAEVLTAIEICSRELAGEALVVGVIMAPFSPPVMQLGFGEYLTLLAEQPEPRRAWSN